ncbi:MAG: DUF58 domain-containing protein [Gammaproteobacteria bacterium]|nr:DUF58 domain-containing protein [Gammaproteobacteria bacterium]
MSEYLLRRFRSVSRPDSRGKTLIASRQIYILPTAQGYAFGLMLIAMLLGAINYASNLGFLLTFLLAGLGLVSMVHTWRNLLGLELSPAPIEPVFAGQRARYRINLQNHRLGPRPGLCVERRDSDPDLTDLEGVSRGTVSLAFRTGKRGEYPLPSFVLSTRYPLGLLRAWTHVRLEGNYLVYPAPGPSIPLTDSMDYTPSAKGDKGVGADDFIGLRQYRPGDSPRHLSWKALAREQDLQTKMFGGDRVERCWLDLDSLPGQLENRLSRLCRGVLDACDQQLEFGLKLPGNPIAPARGQKQRRRCLEALARFGETP